MKIKDGFMVREVSGEILVVPVGAQSIDFKSVIRLNETGAFLWNKLQEDVTEDELLDAILNEYDIDKDIASVDIRRFVEKLIDAGIIE